MNNYDMQSQYKETLDLTLSDLCAEISNEEYDKYNIISTLEAVYKKLKSPDGSGLINKLKSKINFDIEQISENDPKEKFNMFKLLKFLYFIEKESSGKRIKIIDILAKPTLDNVPSLFSQKSTYGDVYQNLYDTIRNQVDDVHERDSYLNLIDYKWNSLVANLYDYVISDNALKNADTAYKEMDRINTFLKSIINKLGTTPSSIPSNEGVMKTFYNILKCHEFLCNDCDSINIYSQMFFNDDTFNDLNKIKVSKEYIEKFTTFERKCINPINISKKDMGFVKNHPLSEDFLNILYDINYNFPVKQEDYKHYKFAFQYFDTVANWYLSYHNGSFENDGSIAYDTFISIIQEMIYVKKSAVKIRNQYFGNKNQAKTLISYVKDPGFADPIAIKTWVLRIHNRVAINFGANELISKKRDLENNIHKIKELIYSYRNFEDLKLINDVLYRWVQRSTIPQTIGFKQLETIAHSVLMQLPDKYRNIKFEIKSQRILHLGIELISDKAMKQLVIQHIKEKLLESICNKLPIQNGYLNVEINNNTYTLNYSFENNILKFIELYEVYSDETIEKMQLLGLSKYVSKNNTVSSSE